MSIVIFIVQGFNVMWLQSACSFNCRYFTTEIEGVYLLFYTRVLLAVKFSYTRNVLS